jgi:hypothetical protein
MSTGDQSKKAAAVEDSLLHTLISIEDDISQTFLHFLRDKIWASFAKHAECLGNPLVPTNLFAMRGISRRIRTPDLRKNSVTLRPPAQVQFGISVRTKENI